MISSILLSVVTLLLPVESAVRGTEIELGEIVTIQGADEATRAALESLEIAGAPTPGYRRVIDRADIAAKVQRLMPDLEFHFGGRTAVSVFPEVFTVDGATIASAVEAKLAGLRGKRDITWTAAKVIGAVDVPRGETATGAPELVVELENSELTTGNLGVAVRIQVNGITYRTVWADWKVSVWEALPVLTQNVPAGSKVSPAYFELRRTELPGGKADAILSPAAMVGAIATRNLLVGSVVVESDVTRPQVIHIGDQLVLIVKKGSIRARVHVEALASAGVGDTLRVKRLDSEVEIKAQVLSSDLVELDLGL